MSQTSQVLEVKIEAGEVLLQREGQLQPTAYVNIHFTL